MSPMEPCVTKALRNNQHNINPIYFHPINGQMMYDGTPRNTKPSGSRTTTTDCCC